MSGHGHILLFLLWILISPCFTLAEQNEINVVQLHVDSVITHRFSTTHVTCVLHNEADDAREATFDLRLPKAAFISNFSMTIEGEVYPGKIEEKAKAKDIYNAAVKRGQSAGYIRASPRQSSKFAVSVNVAAAKNVTFDLVYQELLQRRLGLYEHVIYIDPGQLVDDLMVEVYIVESRVITDLSVPPITNDLLTDEIIEDRNEYAHIDMLSETSAYVSFGPKKEEQERFSSQGVSGQFIVNYDVEHESDGVGEILVSDGYFVHYFAPDWLEPMSKQIMFVLDTSGSMSGKKILQLKQAMVTILKDLSPEDEFGIITFSSDVKLWKHGEMLPASEENIVTAKNHANDLYARGGTNIDSALTQGIDLLEPESRKAAMLIFLTDGQATSGETNNPRILGNIRERNEGVSIFCLGFGEGADFELLQRISAQNNGVARKIYEDADATLQLAGFYDEISSPLLSDLKIRYIGDALDNSTLTETNLHCLFDGAEMIVAGELKEYYNNITAINETGPTINLVIEGDHMNNTLVLKDEIYLADTKIEDIPKLSPGSIKEFTKRLWVYLTIKQLIDTNLQSTSPEKANETKARALDLSIKYGFVTPFTSMVVTKPGEDEKDVREVAGDDILGRKLYPIYNSGGFSGVTYNSGGASGPTYNSRGRSGMAYSPPSLPGISAPSISRSQSKPVKTRNQNRRKKHRKVTKPAKHGMAHHSPPSLPDDVSSQYSFPVYDLAYDFDTYDSPIPSANSYISGGYSGISRSSISRSQSNRLKGRISTSSISRSQSNRLKGRKQNRRTKHRKGKKPAKHGNEKKPTKHGKRKQPAKHGKRKKPAKHAGVPDSVKLDLGELPATRSKYPAAMTFAVQVKHSTEGRVNVCFDLPKSTASQSKYSLIQSNIDLTGSKLQMYEDGKKFQEILLKVGNRSIEFSTKGVKFESTPTVGWWQLKFKDIVDGVVLKDGSLKMFTGPNNSSVTVNKHGIKSRRSRAKPFLTLKVDIPKQQLTNTKGLLGKILVLPKPSFPNTNKIVYGPMSSQVYKFSLGEESCYRMTNTKTIAKLVNL